MMDRITAWESVEKLDHELFDYDTFLSLEEIQAVEYSEFFVKECAKRLYVQNISLSSTTKLYYCMYINEYLEMLLCWLDSIESWFEFQFVGNFRMTQGIFKIVEDYIR